MKKITGFFLALLPIFVIVLMFVSGMIVKQYKHVFVDAVEFVQDSVSIQKVDDNEVYTVQLETVVLPHNASNPNINFYSSNDNVISIDQNGLVTANDFGEAYVYAVAEENETINAECKIEVWDDKIHRIDVRNDAEARYLGLHQSVLLDAVPVPSTRIKEDPTLHYSLTPGDEAYVDLSLDGTVLAKKETDADHPNVTINIETANGEIDKEFKIQIGDGVTSIDLKDPSTIETKDDTFNLYNEIEFYPEEESSKILPEDFIYTTSDADTATISKQGEIKFLQPGTATFTAKYIRDENLSVSKTITSTCSRLLDVFFNCYNFEGSLNELRQQPIPKEKVNWHLYPESQQVNDDEITLTSDNPDVVSIIDNQLYVNNQAGYATITAEYAIPGEEVKKKDQCTIHIYNQNPDESFIKQTAVTADSWSYPLRQNILTDKLINENQNVTYTVIDGSDYVDQIDQDKEILNFKGTGTVTIQASSLGKTPQTFTVTSPIMETEIITNPTQDQITLEVGKRYTFYSAEYGHLWANWSSDYYKNNFYHGYNSETGRYWFVPRAGGVFKDAIIYYEGMVGEWEEYNSSIDIIIHEEPIEGMIRAVEGFPYYSSFKQEVFPSNIITAYPKTATQADGIPYKPTYAYNPEDPSQVLIDEETGSITYRSSVNVGVTATFGDVTKDYCIKSTVGSIGKFALEEPNSHRIIQSGETINLLPGVDDPVTFDLSTSTMFAHDLPSLDQLANDFEITSLSGNCAGEVTYTSEDNKLHFNFKAKEEANGSDVIKISTQSFIFYLNTNIDPNINDFNLYYKASKLKEGYLENNISYTKNLILDIEASPIKAIRENKTYKVFLNGNDITTYCIDDDKIDFTKTEIKQYLQTNNIIKIKADVGKCERQFNVQMLDEPETIDFTIAEADEDNNVYLACGATRGALTIKIDGFVDDEFYEQFSFNYVKKHNENAMFDKNIKNKIIISNIDLPSDYNPGFDNTIDVTFTPASGNSITKTFTINRDTISKVVLPNHDNLDIWDQRGLQKVRVFGNQSYYTKEEGLIDAYKLPIEIYDYKGSLIKDASRKEKAFNQLKISITSPNNQANTAWKYQDGYVWIDFDEQSLYSPKEIYDNAYVDGHKNVLFKAATKSGFAHAQYSFIPVKGINAYCQEAIIDNQAVVLQTNFGLEGSVRDNTPFDVPKLYDLIGIYGNGYTINFDASSKIASEEKDQDDLLICYMFNTTFQGCNDVDVKTSILDLQTKRSVKEPRYFAYNTIKNLGRGLFIYDETEDSPAYVKNCLFYNNYQTSINVNADGNTHDTKMYIEDCVMFNCSSAAIDQVLGADVYFKGFIDVYNFKNRDVLKNILGHDLSFLWDTVRPELKAANALQIGADGREYVNSYLLQGNQGDTYFWNGEEYEESGVGLETAAPYLTHFIDVDVSEIFGFSAGLWGTPNLETEPNAPSYYDQFDKDGNLRWDFLNAQVRKVSRVIIPTFLLYI